MIKSFLIAGALAVGLADIALAQPAVGRASVATPPSPSAAASEGQALRQDRPGLRMMMRRGRARGPSLERMQQNNAARFARLDINKDGQVNFTEFHQAIENARMERERQAFSRLADGRDTLTLDQLNTRAAERAKRWDGWRGRGGPADGDVGARRQ